MRVDRASVWLIAKVALFILGGLFLYRHFSSSTTTAHTLLPPHQFANQQIGEALHTLGMPGDILHALNSGKPTVISEKYMEYLESLQMEFLTNQIGFGRSEEYEQYFAYDSSSKQALFDLTRYLFDHKVNVPLTPNRFEYTFDKHAAPPIQAEVCVGITTARRTRSPFAYLVQTVVSLLTRMDPARLRDGSVYIHVFNVDANPSAHMEVNLIRHLVPVSELKSMAVPGQLSSKVQGGLDYVEAMRELRRVGCQYPLMVEDDAIADNHWLEKVLDGLRELQGRDWFVLKQFVARKYYNLLPNGLNLYRPRFNTVALLIHPDHVEGFASAMVEQTKAYLPHGFDDKYLYIDLFLEEYADDHRLSVLSYEPVAFQHTGVYSSLTRGLSNLHNWGRKSRYFESEGMLITFNPARGWSASYQSVGIRGDERNMDTDSF